jgi:hypothetical protein
VQFWEESRRRIKSFFAAGLQIRPLDTGTVFQPPNRTRFLCPREGKCKTRRASRDRLTRPADWNCTGGKTKGVRKTYAPRPRETRNVARRLQDFTPKPRAGPSKGSPNWQGRAAQGTNEEYMRLVPHAVQHRPVSCRLVRLEKRCGPGDRARDFPGNASTLSEVTREIPSSESTSYAPRHFRYSTGVFLFPSTVHAH